MSKGGKGGGGGSVPNINVPQGLKDQTVNLGGLGNYESQFLNFPGSLGNYYESLATGGAGPQMTEGWTGSFTGQGLGNLTGSPVQTYAPGGTPSGQTLGQTPVFSPGQGWVVNQPSGGQGAGTQMNAPGGMGKPIERQPVGGGSSGTFNPGGSNPWVSQEWNALMGAESIPGQIQGIEQTTGQVNNSILESMKALQGTESGALLPGQQAMIDAQVQSGQAAIRSQLGAEGLTSSTMGAELESEIGLQGAATGGQLEQGNIQLLQSAQKLALGGQTLALGESEALGQAFSQINTMANTDQAQLFSQAMQGYGMVGQFLNNALAPYGMSMQGYQDQIQAQEAFAQDQTSLLTAQMSSQASQSQGIGSLFQGLGSLFGSGAGLGSLGGAASAIPGVGTAVGAIGGSGGALSGILGAVGGLVAAF